MGVDPNEKPAWEVGLVEISKSPSKYGCSDSSAEPPDVLPTISRIGRVEEG